MLDETEEIMLTTEEPIVDRSSMEYILRAFSFNNIQSALQIKNTLDRNGVSWDKFSQWVHKRIEDGETPPLRPMPDQIRTKLEKNRITWAQFSAWLDLVISSRVPDGFIAEVPDELVCPECGYPMKQTRVNTTNCNQVGGDWKSIWNCPKCGHDQLDKRDLKTKKITVKSKKRKSSRKDNSLITDPKKVKFLYYRDPRRRMR